MKILLRYLKVSIWNELMYPANFIMHTLDALFTLATGLCWLGLLFSRADTLAGWKAMELVMVMGLYTLFRGFLDFSIKPGLQRFIEDIRRGTLDFVLMKPLDSQWVISIQQIRIWSLAEIGMGLATMGVATARMDHPPELKSILGFMVVMLAGFFIVYSFLLMLATTAFWLIQMENVLDVFERMYQAGRWPVDIYPKYLRWLLTFLVPIGIAITVPAEVLTSRVGWDVVGMMLVAAAGMFLLSRWFWKHGLRHYSGASS